MWFYEMKSERKLFLKMAGHYLLECFQVKFLLLNARQSPTRMDYAGAGGVFLTK